METATLQICKRIYNEGTPDVYSKNVFNISKAKQLHRFINQVGAVNLKLVRHLDIWISHCSNPDGWLSLFKFFADKATALRHIKVGFGADPEWFMDMISTVYFQMFSEARAKPIQVYNPSISVLRYPMIRPLLYSS